MSTASQEPRVYLLGNPDKPDIAAVIENLRAFASSRCAVVGSGPGLDGGLAAKVRADRIVVLGGDGTLIGVARSLGQEQIPLIGVNVGKLGFLTEFSIEELKTWFDQAVADDTLITRRAALHVALHRDGDARGTWLAINDCVIQAGPPFRIINLDVSINGDHLTKIRGDGLIVCSPSGSTGHNLSAGGPIMQPGVDAIILTPMNPHSLTHRPLVVERESVIDIHGDSLNEGTMAIIDGQVSCPLQSGDRISVRRSDTDFMLVRNPRFAKWHKLIAKLHWGHAPHYR